jgi:hypothetical protein
VSDTFKWISSDSSSGKAFITLDSQKRLAVSSAACDVLGVDKDGDFRLHIGYDAVNKRIVVAKPEVVRVTDVKPFKFDKRRYSSGRPVLSATVISEAELPLRYIYKGRDYGEVPAGSYVFQLEDTEAPDEKGAI